MSGSIFIFPRTCLLPAVSFSFLCLLMVEGAAVAKEKVWEGMLKAVVVVRFSWRIVTMEEEEELKGIGEDGLADPEEKEESSREEGEEREEVDEEEESLSDLEEDVT